MLDHTTALQTANLAAMGLIAYHHAGYPLLLRAVARPGQPPAPLAGDDLPAITIVMPAYNEARHVARKLRNLASLDYPAARLAVIVACDGCTDGTAAIARATLAEPACRHLCAIVLEHAENRGKVAVLNETMAMVAGGIVVLTDVSALLAADALRRAAAHFADPALGAVGGTYRIENPGSTGEAAYWRVQLGVKRGEAALGAPLGLHGAFYAIRRSLFTALEPDTINDDFILPMRIRLGGHRVAYDETIVAVEAERVTRAVELGRRRRIAAGNAQQLLRLPKLLHPRHGGTALCFASGKALRVAMPLLIAAVYVMTYLLGRDSQAWSAFFGAETLCLILALFAVDLGERAPAPMRVLGYLAAGHAMSLLGIVDFARGRYARPWQRSHAALAATPHVPAAVAVAKRTLDIVIASLALLITAPLWPVLAIGIKLSGPGPVIFRQSRIGRIRGDRAEIFQMMKFRSMVQNAEAASGAVWATKRDPRITAFGRFLRKTRLDEIPQLINVLKGDMSLVGPRPERPGFYGRLETAIPYFATRTDSLRPGITGLAQVRQGYDTSIDDVRRKVGFDHAYSMRLSSLWSWLVLDISIMVRTVSVMALGRGQ